MLVQIAAIKLSQHNEEMIFKFSYFVGKIRCYQQRTAVDNKKTSTKFGLILMKNQESRGMLARSSRGKHMKIPLSETHPKSDEILIHFGDFGSSIREQRDVMMKGNEKMREWKRMLNFPYDFSSHIGRGARREKLPICFALKSCEIVKRRKAHAPTTKSISAFVESNCLFFRAEEFSFASLGEYFSYVWFKDKKTVESRVKFCSGIESRACVVISGGRKWRRLAVENCAQSRN